MVTNDGATIAKEVVLRDKTEDMGARMIKEVAVNTNDAAGDGTTTATVLAQSIIHEGFKNVAAGADPLELKKGLQGATQLAAAAIRKIATPVKTMNDIAQVASISAADAEIGEMIAEALESAGNDGAVTIDESKKIETVLDIKAGMHIERGYLLPEMVTDKEQMTAELYNPYILITDRKISDPYEIAGLLDKVAEEGRPLLIIAEAVEAGALGMLVMNKRNGTLDAVAIHPPAFGEGRRARMEDLAVMTGGIFITDELGYMLRDATLDMLGSAATVRVKRNSTVIVDGNGDKEAIASRVARLRMLIEKSGYNYDRKTAGRTACEAGKRNSLNKGRRSN